MNALDMLKAFLKDEKAYEMFIEGRAGTGKTTTTGELVQYLIDEDIPYVVCAFTHKACSVLASKLPKGANIMTLHKWLKKRPGINEDALHHNHVSINYQQGKVERPVIALIDEFSQAGERDYLSILELQDVEDLEGNPVKPVKALYIGDPYQLPPVGDMQTIRPKKPYHLILDKVHRTNRDDIMNAMSMLIDAIKGGEPIPIEPSENIIRGINLVEVFKASANDKAILAWTNKAVQELNAAIEGKTYPDPHDIIFSASIRHELEFLYEVEPRFVTEIRGPLGPIPLGTKYQTLEFLLKQDYLKFMQVLDLELNEEYTIATVFGSNNYVRMFKQFRQEAVQINKEIANDHIKDDETPAQWARRNYQHSMAKERAIIWRKALTFNEAVLQTDFKHAMTVHKSQGSTYEEVYIDTEDLANCADKDFILYLKLFYVALSRASKKVFTN